jgi:hypothetical protein
MLAIASTSMRFDAVAASLVTPIPARTATRPHRLLSVILLLPCPYTHRHGRGQHPIPRLGLVVFVDPSIVGQPILDVNGGSGVLPREFMKTGTWPEGTRPAPQIPTAADCHSCHRDHGLADTTFVQFHPTLLKSAKQHGTARPD